MRPWMVAFAVAVLAVAVVVIWNDRSTRGTKENDFTNKSASDALHRHNQQSMQRLGDFHIMAHDV